MIRVICLVGLKRRDNVAIMRRLTEEMYSVAERQFVKIAHILSPVERKSWL